ncbi:vitellogenin-like [Arctopsyche grandis]|uniref:vitellogenin-like n=1 Tax=Arctopsyche grandis TaxID=121162 RepID=UPI00406D8961
MQSPSMSIIRNSHGKQPRKTPAEIAKIAQNIATELQHPSNMPNESTLSKMNGLVNWLSTMNLQELEQTAKLIGPQENRADNVKLYAWRVYLDAVAQAGTNAAFTHIKNMIFKNTIRGEEAAQLVAVMPRTLRYPTKRLLLDFFKMTFDTRVKNQLHLNSSLLMASTIMINKAHVNRHTAHKNFPTHIFGRMLSSKDDLVTSFVIPELERELKTAVQNRDTHRVQVFVRAIGNLGHPDILRVFSPYIERRVKVTNYQRMFMVMCMDELAKLFPKQARYTLFNIYNNEGDNYEVRVAAIFELLKARPTLNMLQQMAEATHTDSSIQVRAAIKSAIKYAANLGTQEKKFERLSRYAKAAEKMLSEKEYGFQYSAKYLQYYYSKNLGTGLFQSLGLIGSEDSIIHKYFTYNSRVKFGGWLSPNRVQGGVSSISKLIELIKSTLDRVVTKINDKKDNSKLTADDIAKVFNIKGDLQEELQASLFLKLFSQDRIFAFGEQSFHNLPRYVKSIVQKLENGVEYNYNKFYNQENVDISFPTITGMPFFLKSRSPVYIQLKGKVQAKINPKNNKEDKLNIPNTVNVTGDLQLVLARDSEGRVGFYCPMGDKYMTSGVIRKSQINIPLRSKVNVDVINSDVSVEVSPLNPSEESRLYHDSMDSYTSVRERDSTIVPTQHKETKFNLPQHPKYDFNTIYGKDTFGMALEVRQVYNSLPPQRSLRDQIMDTFIVMIKPQSKTLYKNRLTTIKYQPQQSQNQQIVFSLGYNTQEPHPVKGAWSPSDKVISQYPSDVSCGSKARQQQLLETAVFGIPEGQGYILDVGVQCLGKANAQFSASIARGNSKLDERSRLIFFYNHQTASGKPFQAYSVISAKMPTVPTLDFVKALEFNSSLDFDMILKYGESVNNGAVVTMKGQMSQTPDRKEYLKNAPMAKLCELEMASGNFLMPACQNVTIRANVMNALSADVQYNNIGDGTRRLAYLAHHLIRHHLYYNIRDDWLKQTKPGTIQFQADFGPAMNGLVSVMSTPIVEVQYINFHLSQWGKAIAGIVMNPTVPMFKQYADRVYGYQYQPTCAIDGKSVNTFSNQTYKYAVGNCWHVAMQNGSHVVDAAGQSSGVFSALQQSSVLVKGNNGKKDFLVTYRSLSGDDITIEYYQGDNILVNKKQVQLTHGKSVYEWTKDKKSKLMEAYMINGELTINVDNEKLTIISNGDRMLISVSDSYRNTTSGLCGDNSGDSKFDLATPSNCYMCDNTLFGATWAMTNDQCDPQVKELQQQANAVPTVCHEQITPSVQPPNMDNGESHTDSSHDHQEGSHQEGSHQGESQDQKKKEAERKKIRQSHTVCQVRSTVQLYEENSEICITEQPIPACSNKCQEGDLYEMTVGVVCQPNTNQEFQAMKKAVELGEDIQLDKTKYKATREDYYMVPKTCK